MIRVVFDTNVFLRGLINRRSWCGRLLFDFGNDIQVVTSRSILFELLDVIDRPEIQERFPHIAQIDYTEFRALIEDFEILDPPNILPISRDPKDDKVLACAKEGQTEYLVTEDKDLLVLRQYEGTRIITPIEFLQVLEARRP